MPPVRQRLRADLFQTRTDLWRSAGLGEEVEFLGGRPRKGLLLVALILIAGVLVLYGRRGELAPGYETWIQVLAVVVIVVAGSAAATLLGRWLSPVFYRRLDPSVAGTVGFLDRLVSLLVVVIVALRIAGVTMGTLAVGGAFTAIVLGLAAQQTVSNIFAGIVLQGTRPFRVGQRVRLVGGALAGSLEGTVSSLGLFYTTLAQGADRLRVPNSVLLTLVIVPLREPEKLDVRVRFGHGASPHEIEQRLRESISVPTRYPPHVGLEEIDDDGVVLRINATPVQPQDGSALADQVLEALHRPLAAAGTDGGGRPAAGE
jgi:small-conductance mechanosensitive channel